MVDGYRLLKQVSARYFLPALAVFLFALPLPAVQPLSKDDITLLLIGGASPQKIMTLVAERGVDFQMTPALAKEFRQRGATNELIQEIEKVSKELYSAAPPAPAAQNPPPAPRAATSSPPTRRDRAGRTPTPSSPPSPVQQKINQEMAGLAGHPAPEAPPELASASSDKAASAEAVAKPNLSDPSPSQIHDIIQEFAAKETLFKEARDNYTYHQINRVETLDADGNVDGAWEQDWDILYDDQGNRIEKVTYAPVGSLKRVLMTEQDLDAMRNIQPFVLTSDELPEYEIKYLGHVVLDKLTPYVFSLRPKEIKKGHQYFQGVVWVDDRDLQIVKTEGRQVPELRNKHGENLFPRFSTWRQQIDGKFWFPTFTRADDTLYFPEGPVHIKEIIRYTDYKQFKSTSTIKMIGLAGSDKTKQPAKDSPATSPPPNQ